MVPRKVFFQSSKGIRQGDPPSPILFKLVVNALSILMDWTKSRGIIEGFHIANNGFSINHLQFADDTMCFFKANEIQVMQLKDILQIFETLSGLKINLLKNKVARIEVEGEELDILKFWDVRPLNGLSSIWDYHWEGLLDLYLFEI